MKKMSMIFTIDISLCNFSVANNVIGDIKEASVWNLTY
jgi:hypothetical protein